MWHGQGRKRRLECLESDQRSGEWWNQEVRELGGGQIRRALSRPVMARSLEVSDMQREAIGGCEAVGGEASMDVWKPRLGATWKLDLGEKSQETRR